MNRKLTASLLSLFLVGGVSTALAQTEKTEESKKTTADGTMTSKKHTVVGTVTAYEAGKSIKLDLGNKKTKKFALDSKSVNTSVDSAVAVGSKVKVVQSKNADGMKTLSISPAS